MRFGSAISEHPVTAIATGEVAGAVFDAVGESPSLCVGFVTPAHAGALEDVMRTVEAVLRPSVAIAAVAESIVGPAREVEKGPGISLWAASSGEVAGLRLGVGSNGVVGWPARAPVRTDGPRPLGGSVHVPDRGGPRLDQRPRARATGCRRDGVGGSPDRNQRAVARADRYNGRARSAALLGPGLEMEPLVSQGCRPFGRPLVVTRSDGNLIYELAGKPALERLVAQASSDLLRRRGRNTG